MQEPAPSLKRRPALNGLRGLAVVAVVLYHFNTRDSFPGGLFGVDLFFALSGFLITSLLLTEWQNTGGISLRRFYVRRALRLMPAFFAFIAIYVCYSIAFRPDTETGTPTPQQALQNAGLALTYLYSWAIAFDQVVPGGFMPLWSLSVEEQFYVVWPVLLWLLLVPGRVRPQVVLLLTFALFALSAGQPMMQGWGPLDKDLLRSSFGADYRAQGLLAGCIAGIACATGLFKLEAARSAAFRCLMAASAAVLVVALLRSNRFLYTNYYQISMPVLSIAAAVVVCGASFIDRGLGRFLLGNPVMSYLGARSYAIYLWHYPIGQEFRGMDALPQLLVAGALTLAVAEASHLLVERPALNLRDRLTRRNRPSVVEVEQDVPGELAAQRAAA